MRARSRVHLLVAALALATACGPRQVEVGTAPRAAIQQMVRVTNNLSQSVNVYAVTGAGSENDLYLQQVPANTVKDVPVPSVRAGASVTFKAVTVDGSRTYQSRSVALTGVFNWAVP